VRRPTTLAGMTPPAERGITPRNRDKRPTVTILVAFLAFIISARLVEFPTQFVVAALCGALAWVLTPKPGP